MSWKKLFRRTAPPKPVIMAIQKPTKVPQEPDQPSSEVAHAANGAVDHKPIETIEKQPTQPVPESDLLQLDRECMVDESGVRKIFTPGVPLSTRDFLFGRLAEVSSVLEAARTPGMHVVIVGERGIGKSSLANVSSTLLVPGPEMLGSFRRVLTCRCDATTSFNGILESFFNKLNIDYRESSFRPGAAAELLGSHSALLVVDEFDTISSDADVHQMGEFIKLLSDSHSSAKLMIVGIAETSSILMRGHKSIDRNVREVHLNLLADPEILRLLNANAVRAGLTYSEGIPNRIVELSAGFPYFAQLLGLHSAEEAVAGGSETINTEHFEAGLRRAVTKADHGLSRSYTEAILDQNTQMYKLFVHAAATIPSIEFSTSAWRETAGKLAKTSFSEPKAQQYIPKVVANDRSKIITRLRPGFFRFTDLRMRSFVRMQLQVDDHQYLDAS